jgi:hypothetical protein
MTVGVAYGVAPAFFAVLATLLITNFFKTESIIPIIVFVIVFLIIVDVFLFKLAKGHTKIEHPFHVSDSVFGAICTGLVFILPLVFGFMLINFAGRIFFGVHMDTTVLALSIALSAAFGMKNIKAFVEFREHNN